MKTYTQEEVLDRTLGMKGTPERDKYDVMVDDYLVGLAFRRAREAHSINVNTDGQDLLIQNGKKFIRK